VLNQALTPIGSGTGTGPVPGGGLPTPGGPTTTGRPVYAVAAAGGQSFVRFSVPQRANAAAAVTDSGIVEVVDAASLRATASATALEGPLTIVTGTARVNVSGRMMALDPAGTTAYVITASGLSMIPLDAGTNAQTTPVVPANGVVNTANYQSGVAPGGLISIFGRNLATNASAPGMPLPTLLGGACVTLNGTPHPAARDRRHPGQRADSSDRGGRPASRWWCTRSPTRHPRALR